MAELNPDIVTDVLKACEAGSEEAGAALSRALDLSITLAVGEESRWSAESPLEGIAGPGLAVAMKVGESGALFLLPSSSDLVPDWCAAPDPTGESKLMTLAQELGMLLLPEDFLADDFRTKLVEDLPAALATAKVADDSPAVSLKLTSEDKEAQAWLLWPASELMAVFEVEAASDAAAPEQAAPASEAPKPAAAPVAPAPSSPADSAPTKPSGRSAIVFEELPSIVRSYLRVNVPIIVNLADKSQPLRRIMELGPGSIIQFDKSCEEMLDMEVGGCKVATGEAVKVGDKFGLRITSITMPEERFQKVKPVTS